MTIIDPVWLFQMLVAAGSAGAFVAVTVQAIKHPVRPIERHTVITALALVLISIGNIVTSFATGTDNEELRNFAGAFIRGVLAVLAVYLATANPFRPKG